MSKQIMPENLELDVKIVSVNFPLRLTMSASDNASFDFVTSVDEFGHILLIPLKNETNFDKVETLKENSDIPNLTTTVTTTNDVTCKSFTLNFTTTMFQHDEDVSVFASVDEVGQVLICPTAKDNMFITATVEENNIIVTEDVDFVKQSEVACDILVDSKHVGGLLQCESIPEATHMTELLLNSYDVVNIQSVNNKYIIKYYKLQTDKFKEIDDRLDLILRFLQGKINTVEGEGEPNSSWQHINELDSDNCKYYYDEEQDVIISYGAVA